MDERVLALCELSNDLLFHKIPTSMLSEYVDASLAAGGETAGRFAGQDIFDLYKQQKITIEYHQSGKQNYGVILRGQVTMSAAECSVEVYRDSIDELARYSTWNGESLDYDQALAVHLAHEFYHFWEYQTGESVVERLPSVVTLKLLGYERRAKIRRCEEIAAHSFAKTLLGLPVLPNLYDYLYLTGSGKMERVAFTDLLTDMAARLDASDEKEDAQ